MGFGGIARDLAGERRFGWQGLGSGPGGRARWQRGLTHRGWNGGRWWARRFDPCGIGTVSRCSGQIDGGLRRG